MLSFQDYFQVSYELKNTILLENARKHIEIVIVNRTKIKIGYWIILLPEVIFTISATYQNKINCYTSIKFYS